MIQAAQAKLRAGCGLLWSFVLPSYLVVRAARTWIWSSVNDPGGLRSTRRELPRLALFGVVGVAFVQLFYFLSIHRLPVGISMPPSSPREVTSILASGGVCAAT